MAEGVISALDYTRSGERLMVAEESGTVRALDADTLEPVGRPYDTGLLLTGLLRGATDDTAIVIARDTTGTENSVVLVDLTQGRPPRHAETEARTIGGRTLAQRPAGRGR